MCVTGQEDPTKYRKFLPRQAGVLLSHSLLVPLRLQVGGAGPIRLLTPVHVLRYFLLDPAPFGANIEFLFFIRLEVSFIKGRGKSNLLSPFSSVLPFPFISVSSPSFPSLGFVRGGTRSRSQVPPKRGKEQHPKGYGQERRDRKPTPVKSYQISTS